MTGTPYQQGNAVVLIPTFLVGTTPTDPTTVTFKIRNPDGTLTTLIYGVDANVTRLAEGVYQALLAPADAGQYHYEAVGTGTCEVTLPGEFYVIASSVDPPQEAPGPVLGPGQTWINGEDLVSCAGFDPTAEPQLADAAAVEASMTLYELSGRQFAGLCGPITVRPMVNDGCNHWAGDYVYGGYTWVWLDNMAGWAWSGQGNPIFGCGWVSTAKLPGYPVREIVEVKIDGDVLPTTYDGGAPTYRLDKWRFLTRLNDPDQPALTKAWPACQNLTLEDDQPGTFSVSMKYGVNPPPLGIEAAKQLACQILLAQSGQACQLPIGATKITRTGVQIERSLLATWGPTVKGQGWQTGLSLVDLFLNTVNANRLRRRPAVISPDIQRFAPALGEQS